MATWKLEVADLKNYPHFDPPISAAKATVIATDPNFVAKHAFHPFMRYHQRWTKFAEKGATGKRKERPIRYAARRDAYILAYYRHILSERYENELQRLGLRTAILAYRRIPDVGKSGNKCNIHFARDAFLDIRRMRNCAVVALDISSFFENLDHDRLRSLWCRMLGVSRLPDDHFNVFKAVTTYSVVDKEAVYRRLGFFGPKSKTKSGKTIEGYLVPYVKIPKQLCTPSDFRTKIAKHGTSRSIIERNYKTYGVPQGAPISDLLANLYLLDFDAEMMRYVSSLGGVYYRYSDDILLIAPGNEHTGRSAKSYTQNLIRKYGRKLQIKDEKTSILVFEANEGELQSFKHIDGSTGKNGLEYLGFRYDGRKAYIRDSTLSSLYRRIAKAAARRANIYARRYPDKDAAAIQEIFNYEELIKEFGKVENFDKLPNDYRSWTFWTYARRSAHVFGPLGKSILWQLRKHRKNIRRRAEIEIERAVTRRNKRRAIAA